MLKTLNHNAQVFDAASAAPYPEDILIEDGRIRPAATNFGTLDAIGAEMPASLHGRACRRRHIARDVFLNIGRAIEVRTEGGPASALALRGGRFRRSASAMARS